ncbi:MAG: cellulase family glycosylhydrolase [Gemmataceae bacterium]
MIRRIALSMASLVVFVLTSSAQERWTAEKATEWGKKQTWLVGCNFIPSNAINQIEMWQKDTFDAKLIDKELKWAADLGFNCMRVFLHDLAWHDDPVGFKKRVDEYLTISAKHKIRTMFVLFDDCWNANPKLGKQPDPQPGVHNSGWVQGPGVAIVNDPAKREWPRLENYVSDMLTTFGKDDRIVLWDLYNEPGNSGQNEKSLPLLKEVVRWARKAEASQPLSVGLWFQNAALNEYQLSVSDVVTFHNYNDAKNLKNEITALRKHGRPILCTEYMARKQNSRFEIHLPLFREMNVGAINWGFVSGKTNTIYPWNSPRGTPEPKEWFHDILRADGTPFSRDEVTAIKKATGKE